MRSNLLVLLICCILQSACTAPNTVVFIVRHAEKESTGTDPNLAARGLARSKELRDKLKEFGINAVYATHFRRTQQTAQATANYFDIPVSTYDTVPNLVQTVLNQHTGQYSGQAVLIVAHSNTVGDIILGFGAPLPSELDNPIKEDDYNNFIRIAIDHSGNVTVTHEQYGTQ